MSSEQLNAVFTGYKVGAGLTWDIKGSRSSLEGPLPVGGQITQGQEPLGSTQQMQACTQRDKSLFRMGFGETSAGLV